MHFAVGFCTRRHCNLEREKTNNRQPTYTQHNKIHNHETSECNLQIQKSYYFNLTGGTSIFKIT